MVKGKRIRRGAMYKILKDKKCAIVNYDFNCSISVIDKPVD
jgi:hypothetical protein